MELYKSILSRALLSIFLIASSLAAQAQSAPEIKAEPKIDSPKVEKNGVVYTILSDKLAYEINVSGGEGYSISKAEWVLSRDGSKVDTSDKLVSEGTSQINFSTSGSGLYKMTGEVTVELGDTTIKVLPVVAKEVNLLPVPTIDIVGDTKIVSYHDLEFDLKLSSTTKEGKWNVAMKSSNSNVKIDDKGNFTYKAKLSNTTGNEIKFTITADCAYTYEGVELYTVKKQWNVTVYPQISITNPDDEVWNTAKSGSREFSIDVKGGHPDGWSYQWTKDNKATSDTGKSKKVEVTADKKESNTYQVTAINKYNNVEFDRVSKKFTVNVFPKIGLEYVSDSEFHIKEETPIELKVKSVGGNDEDGAWEYIWSKDGVTIENNNKASYKETITPGNESDVIKFRVIAKNRYDGELLDEVDKEFVVNVYATPQVSQGAYQASILGNVEERLYIDYSGGNPKGWTFEWLRNDVTVAGPDEELYQYKFTENNDGQSPVTVTYKVKVKNTFGNEIWLEEEAEFVIKVYPNVKIEHYAAPYEQLNKVIHHLYQEDKKLGIKEPDGGCKDEGSSWQYFWDGDESTSQSREYDYKSYINIGAVTDSTKTLRVLHKLNDDVLYDHTFEYKIKNYSKAVIKNGYTYDNMIVSGGTNVGFAISAKYANPNGWSYVWKKDGAVIQSGTSYSWSGTEQNDNETKTLKHKYVVTATNTSPDGKVWVTDSLEFVSIVRPKIISPKQNGYENKVRAGDKLDLSVTEGKGGYVNGWTYKWYKDGYEIIGQNGPELLDYFSEEKSYSSSNLGKSSWTETYKLEYENRDSTNLLHEHNAHIFEVKIYRVPQKPYELVKKGGNSNKSNIYIADMYRSYNEGLTNDQLVNNEYRFCFGYGNNEIVREDPTVRYHQYTKQQANNGPWVYTYWEYDDFVCKSDKVYYKGGTRGTTSVDGVYEGSVININNYGFTAVLPYEMPAVARVISINGEVVRVLEYERSSDFNEKFELSGLKSGLYLIEVQIGDNREVNKIFINE